MDASSKVVQHINKKSSDELLRKFADDAPAQAPAPVGRELVRVSKRRKRSGPTSREVPLLNVGGGASSLVLVERKRPASRRSGVLRQLGIGRSQLLRGREIRNKSLFCTIQKTWRRTVEGASRVLMEKQYYNRHKRLINVDAV